MARSRFDHGARLMLGISTRRCRTRDSSLDGDRPALHHRGRPRIRRRNCSAWDRREAAHFAIAGSDDRLIGYLGVLSIEDRISVVELGYWVGPWARRRGVARRAVLHAVGSARSNLVPRRIELGMLAGNAASRRVAESAGFVFEGTEPTDGVLDGQPAQELIFVLSDERDPAQG